MSQIYERMNQVSQFRVAFPLDWSNDQQTQDWCIYVINSIQCDRVTLVEVLPTDEYDNDHSFYISDVELPTCVNREELNDDQLFVFC